MRTLQTEELELVAGGVDTPAAGVSQSTKNNGLGNGDQGAPGGSYPNNGAENNNDGGPIGGSGFPVNPNL
ncbi:MAG: hypothetical protein K0Q43_4564 [Ramlibacter sp.]|jgi:hypothetical protein|nr:hypothetical protein [Ramlibacter sp.]